MTRNLSATRGTAMLLGGVLGPGLLVLPRLASEAAGPAAIVLGLLATVTGLITAAALIWSLDVGVLIRATSACLAAVNVLGMAAAVRLLPSGRPRAVAATAAVLALAALACCTGYLAIPAALAAFAALLPGRDQAADDQTTDGQAAGDRAVADQAASRFKSGAGTVIDAATGTAKI